MKQIFLFCFALIALPLLTVGQTFKEFSTQDAFLLELEQQLVDKAIGDAKKETKQLHEKLTEMWTELNSFTPEQKNRIFETSNYLLAHKLRMVPEVRDYLITVIAIVESERSPITFNEWHETADVVMKARTARKEYSPYLEFTRNLFESNTIYSSPSVSWSSSNPNFQFSLEDGKPKLTFNELDLKCSAKRSSAKIYGTSGVYYPTDELWIGKNGTVNWVRAGLDSNKVYAIINDYEIKMKFSNYKADSVTFYNIDYFPSPLKGRLEDKVLANVTPDNASFPLFNSYSKRLKIENIDKNVNYEGGFSQKGSRFVASGDETAPAYLTFFLNGKPFLEMNSLSFSIKEDRITSTKAAAKFILHEDSIIHPGLDFKYIRKDRVVNLYKADEGAQKAPYFDSYHAIDIQAELVTWQIDQAHLEFGTIPNSSDNRASFESDFYFRERRFDQLMGMNTTHPMVIIKNCFREKGMERLADHDIAQCLRTSITDAQIVLLTYANLGLVKYNLQTGWVYETPRLEHYVKAKSKMQDYDVIQIQSDIGTKANATMDLVDEVFTLKINGIRNMILSDSHQVVLYPKDGSISMRKNRDFDFSGVVKASKLEFFGSNFEFIYDEFKMEMPNVDSVRMIVSTGEATQSGREKLARVSTVIEDVKGTLEIDHPRNKSGLAQQEQYPIFTSHENSFVYYERSSIQNKAYKRENFYFELDPFVFDSLDNFRNERVQFDGTFKSADIFPEFREKLTVQEDYSLGFIRETPKEGYDVYRGKGKFFNTIKLSHEGLRGDGKLKYLTSTTKSEDFLFLPEEMQTVASSFVIEEQMGNVEYPPTTGKLVKQLWHPYDDNLHCESTEEPFLMYDGSELEGALNLSPEELQGSGLFSFDKAELESNTFHFKFSGFLSDTADFRLKSDVSAFEGFQFKTNNVHAEIDFSKRKGDFISNDGTSMMDFPQNQYVAFMDRFTWYMDQEAIELSGGKSSKATSAGAMQFEGSRFISMHPDQDSLEFYSPAARYDLKNSIIDAKQIEFIQVADALIYPDSGLITVLKRAKMKTLQHAKIVANAITKYHKIDSATVDIFARREYVGTGLYTYRDVTGGKQRIRFSTIGVDSSDQTYAKGSVSAERNFTLSPHFAFKGDINLSGSVKDLTFSGFTKINHGCETFVPMTWFAFKAAIDPEDIYIPIGKVIQDEEDNTLSASIVLDPDTSRIYTAFLSQKPDDDDRNLLPATGFLHFNEDASEYRISNIEKLTQSSLPGQYLSLHKEECKAYGEGKFGFGLNPGQLDLTTVGNIKNDLESQKVEIDALMLIDFMFVDKLIDDMGKTMAENAMGDPVDFERDTYQKGLRELIGTDEADRLISAITLTGQFKKFPSELEKNIFITDMKMRWNPETSSYQSVGKIGLGNVGKRQVNIRVNGKVEVVVGRIPEVNVYLEADRDTYWYFKYSRNMMQAYSSDEEFNSTIGDLKSDKRKMKVEKGEAPYSFMLSSKRRMDDFKKKF